MSRGRTVAGLLLPLLLAGCADAVPQTAPPTGPSSAARRVDTLALPIPLEWDGQLRAVACVPTGVGECRGVAVGAEDDAFHHELTAKPRALNFTLEWKASTPATRELGFSLSQVASKECGDDCTGRRYEKVVGTIGESPLRIDADTRAWIGNETFRIHVFQPRQTPEPVYGYASPQQPFHVRGSVAPGG